MTPDEAIKIMETERTCVLRQDTPGCSRDCAVCDLVLPTADVLEAYGLAIEALTKQKRKVARAAFNPPTKQEVEDYIFEQGFHVNADAFMDYYDSCGWYVGSKKMKDWKATVRNWNRRDQNKAAPVKQEEPKFNPFDY